MLKLVSALRVALKPISLILWFIQKYIPRKKNRWVIGAFHGHGYGDNGRAFYEYVLQNDREIEITWITKSRKVYNELKEKDKPVLLSYSLKTYFYCIRAGFVFITHHPKDVNQYALNGACQVYLWHGLMMKEIGLDAKRTSKKRGGIAKVIQRGIAKRLFPEYQYTPSYVINTSDFFTQYFCSAFGLTADKVLNTGYPRNDLLFTTKKNDFLSGLDEKYDNPVKFLYMPTWRDHMAKKNKPFNPFNSFEFSYQQVLKTLESINGVFMYKGHYNSADQLGLTDSRFIQINDQMYDSLYEFLEGVDVLITDYSSVYFDFLLSNKPVILAPFDLEEYQKRSRKLYYDYDEHIIGAKAQNWKQLSDIILYRKYTPADNSTIRKYHDYDDANSSRRLLQEFKSRISLNV